MISRFSRFVLFASSYAPLSLAFGVLYLKDTPLVAYALFAFCAASILLLKSLLAWVRGRKVEPIDVDRSSRKDTETLSYLATYLIPFALAPPRDAYSFLALMIFVIVLGYLYTNTNMIYINPVLSFFGYHIYEVSPVGARHSLVVLSRDEPAERIEAVEIGPRIYIALK